MESEATTPAAEDTARVDPAPEVDEAATAAEADDQTTDEGAEGEGDELDAEGQPGADDTEEVEHDGQKYRIPKALKGALMMHKDYTQKTQEVAEARRAVEERAKQHAESVKALATEYGAVHAAQADVARFAKVDWDLLRASDPNEYRELRDEQRDAKDRLAEATETLRTKEGERLRMRQTEMVTALQETGRTLAKEIPGWSRETAEKVTSFVAQHGITAQELHETTDPRLWKLFHLAMTASQAKAQTARVVNNAKAAEIAPAATVGAKRPAVSPLSDRASTDAWMKAREAEVRKRA